ncbi:MAG: hypothetical protein KF786_13265 [Burkholderiaceae bacterium]|jgi:hypothetical protein|nr:hypothetical protein [Burkholderiaceae bacterium]
MPYFVFRIAGIVGLPERLAEAPSYREAKAILRELRAREGGDAAPIRMVFAANEIEAADLLTQPREPDPSLYGADD